MWNVRYHIITVCLAVFVIMTACHCEPPAQGGESGKSRISLRLSTSGLPTRASDGSESKEDGNTLENYIDPSDIRICLFGNDGILKSVAYGGVSDGVGMTGTDGNLSVDLDVASSEFGDEGVVKIVVVANFDGFVENLDLTVGATTFDDVRNIVPGETADQNAITRIPMIGEASVSLSEIESDSHIEVAMNRMLAKIEVVDELADDGYEIESVSLYATGETVRDGASATKEISFAHDGNKFRAYIPKRKLGDDVKGRDRRITLNVRKTDSTDTEPYYIYLSKYGDDGEPCADEAESWNTLLPNRIYRFTVTSLKPSLQVQDKIKIIWYYINTTNVSKFYSRYIVVENSFEALDNCNYSFCQGNGAYLCSFEVPASLVASGYRNIAYCFVNEVYKYERISSKGYIWQDAVKIENEGEYTCFYLNDESISKKNGSIYPTDKPYRFYCRGENYGKIQLKKKLDNDKVVYYPGPTGQYFGAFTTDDRGYKYVELGFASGDIPSSSFPFGFDIEDANGKQITLVDNDGTFNCYDIFEQEIDGRKYYVFYLD